MFLDATFKFANITNTKSAYIFHKNKPTSQSNITRGLRRIGIKVFEMSSFQFTKKKGMNLLRHMKRIEKEDCKL